MKKLAVVLVLVAVVWFLTHRTPPPSEAVPPEAETAVTERHPKMVGLPEAKTPPPHRTPSAPKNVASPDLKEKFDLVASLLQDNRRQDALDLLQEILKSSPDNPDALYQTAYLLGEDPKRRAEAVGMLKKALEKDPNHEPSMAELLALAQTGGSMENVYKTVQSAYDRNPESANIAAGMGQLALERGDTEGAIAHLEKAAQDPFYALSSLSALLTAYRESGSLNKTASTYERLIDLQEGLMQKADTEEAAVYQQEINTSRLGLVDTLIASGQLEAAERILQQVRSRDPENPSVGTLQTRLDRAKSGSG